MAEANVTKSVVEVTLVLSEHEADVVYSILGWVGDRHDKASYEVWQALRKAGAKTVGRLDDGSGHTPSVEFLPKDQYPSR